MKPIIFTLMAAMLLFGSGSLEGAQQKITLKAIGYQPKTHLSSKGTAIYFDMVNKAAKGELAIDWIGGPEVVPERLQLEAMKKGVTDIIAYPGGHYQPQLPIVGSLPISLIMPWEERQRGFHDVMVESHKKIGVHYLGRNKFEPGPSFFFFTNRKIEKMQDFKGLKFRSGGLYDEIMKALGVVPVTLPFNEIYTAMEQGLVDGWAASIGTCLQYRLHEVTKYVIFPGFYTSAASDMMRLEKYNSLPKHLQKLLDETHIEAERGPVADFYKDDYNKSIKKMLDTSIKPIELAPAEAKKLLDMAYSVKWVALEKDIGQEIANKVRKMITK